MPRRGLRCPEAKVLSAGEHRWHRWSRIYHSKYLVSPRPNSSSQAASMTEPPQPSGLSSTAAEIRAGFSSRKHHHALIVSFLRNLSRGSSCMRVSSAVHCLPPAIPGHRFWQALAPDHATSKPEGCPREKMRRWWSCASKSGERVRSHGAKVEDRDHSPAQFTTSTSSPWPRERRPLDQSIRRRHSHGHDSTCKPLTIKALAPPLFYHPPVWPPAVSPLRCEHLTMSAEKSPPNDGSSHVEQERLDHNVAVAATLPSGTSDESAKLRDIWENKRVLGFCEFKLPNTGLKRLNG